MEDPVYSAVNSIGKMDQDQLAQLAELLVLHYEGRAVKLATFIEFEHQDKSVRASEEIY